MDQKKMDQKKSAQSIGLQDLKDWIVFTIEMLVANQDSVQVAFYLNGKRDGLVVRVSGPRVELGRVIGREGWIVKHLRSVAFTIASKQGISTLDFEFEPNDESGTKTARHNGTPLHQVSDRR
jgi:predicted RNA-binding protein YlqC (UPF0109 family)